MKTVECGQIFILAVACRQLRKKAQHNFIGQFLNLLYQPRLVYSLSDGGDGGGWSKMKVSFSVSSSIGLILLYMIVQDQEGTKKTLFDVNIIIY